MLLRTTALSLLAAVIAACPLLFVAAYSQIAMDEAADRMLTTAKAADAVENYDHSNRTALHERSAMGTSKSARAEQLAARMQSGGNSLSDDVVLLTGGITPPNYRNYVGKKRSGAKISHHTTSPFSNLEETSTPLSVFGRSFKEMIVDSNPGIEVIAHLWNPQIAQNITEAYSPLKSLFENNSIYEEQFKEVIRKSPTSIYGQISRAFSIFQAVQLMKAREKERGKAFSRVLITRADTIQLDHFSLRSVVKDNGTVYLEALGGSCFNNRDGVYTMSRNAAIAFSRLYASIRKDRPARVTTDDYTRQCSAKNIHWITRFIEEELRMSLGDGGGPHGILYRRIDYTTIVQGDYTSHSSKIIEKLKSWGYSSSMALHLLHRTAFIPLSDDKAKNSTILYKALRSAAEGNEDATQRLVCLWDTDISPDRCLSTAVDILIKEQQRKPEEHRNKTQQKREEEKLRGAGRGGGLQRHHEKLVLVVACVLLLVAISAVSWFSWRSGRP